MTNTIAVTLGALIFGGILLDLLLSGGDTLLFLGKKGAELIEWMAFWR